MEHPIHLLEGDECDLEDDIAPAFDFAQLRRKAAEQEREYHGLLAGKFVRLESDVAEFFKTPEAVTEALRCAA